jgi:lipopolysaccharide/colanic/teichoic acid biosynthesis glycosyltransferase
VLKRAFDVVVSGAMLVLLSPVLAVLALAVRLESPGPVIFSQPRVGKDDKLFAMHKFRTMPWNPDAKPSVPQVDDFKSYVFDPLHGDGRYTRIGHFLRSTSLDELPNLWNVLRGDMSIVGPRPEVPGLVDQFPPEYRPRHNVRPGITGLAQVSGRGLLTYHETILYDLEYVEQHSLVRDLSILARTVPTVLSRKGAR